MTRKPSREELHDGPRTPGMPYKPGLSSNDAIDVIRRTYSKINADRRSNGLPCLEDADLTPAMRANAARFVLGGTPDVDTFATAAAQCIAALVWLLRAEDASPFTGDDAA